VAFKLARWHCGTIARKTELVLLGSGNTIASLANLHANYDLLYTCKAKMRYRGEMFFPVSLHALHFPHITRQHANKLSCFHGYQADTIACNYFCIIFYNVAPNCHEMATGGMLHAACIQACKL
jgi:hypothetical protein